MSGADLANVINEAALLTAREHGTVITNAALEESVDRVVGGPARRGKVISEKEKKITAYHEGGHALAAWAMPGLEPVYKVTILPRGRTGGHALVVPEDDKSLMTRSEMIARLVMAMGGRAAEELVFAEPTTGASSDIAQATKIARAMVTEYGMSAKLGAVKYGHGDDEPFLGRTYGSGPEYSIEVGSEIDGEVRALIEAAHTEAWAVLNTYRDILDSLAVGAAGEGDAGPQGPRGDLRRGREAAADHHLRRVRPAAAVRPAADQDPRRTGDRARRAVAAAGAAARRPVDAPPVPVGAVSGYPGQSGYNTGPGYPRPAARTAWPGRPGPPQAPPNWTGGVLPGPLAPMPGWQQRTRTASAGPQKTLGGYRRRAPAAHPAGPRSITAPVRTVRPNGSNGAGNGVGPTAVAAQRRRPVTGTGPDDRAAGPGRAAAARGRRPDR